MAKIPLLKSLNLVSDKECVTKERAINMQLHTNNYFFIVNQLRKTTTSLDDAAAVKQLIEESEDADNFV